MTAWLLELGQYHTLYHSVPVFITALGQDSRVNSQEGMLLLWKVTSTRRTIDLFTNFIVGSIS